MTAFGIAASRIVTCDPHLPGALGVLDDGVVVIDGERLAYVGPRSGAPAVAIEDVGDGVVTPGLVDAHTHACWAGSRHAEYDARMRGADYLAIARAQGGIHATHAAVAAADEAALEAELVARLRRMAGLGVTTVEVKSGYGLDEVHERKQLAVIRRAAAHAGVPAVVPTFLALHALPPGVNDARARAAFVARVAGEVVPAVAAEGLARFVDAYVDEGAFTVGEARDVGRAARAAGLGVRLHVGQFADVGGAELAAELGAASADHLEHASPAAIEALARAGVSAVLLPTASFTLAQPPPPVGALRAAGVPLVVASDANPGTAPTESLPLAMALAVRLYGLTSEEALLGATRVAAASLRLPDRGVLRAGARADVVAWDLPHEQAIVQPWGTSKTRATWIGGRRRTA
ncbi:MAG TPA: imidazolonepropionase [Polyangiaceae bacterium]|nr:imidazolonepropionase [Polyangiaceae bacterium]